MRKSITISIILLIGLPVFGGIENRPINTDDAFTLSARTFSLSTGTLYRWNRKQNNNADILVVDAGYGLTDTFEITIDIPLLSFIPNASSGIQMIENFGIRPEFRFLDEGRYNPAISIANTIEFQSSGKLNFYPSIQVTKGFGFLTGHFNIGYAFMGGKQEEDNYNGLFYSFGFETDLIEKLVIVGELVGSTNSVSKFSNEPKEILIGLIFNVNEGLALDIGIGKTISGLNPDSDIKITFGGTWFFKKS